MRDGTASWSLSTLRTALRQAPDGLPSISTDTIGRTLHAAGFGSQKRPDLTEAETRQALEQLDPLWDQLFPAEQARIIQLLVERVEVGPDGAAIRLRVAGLTGIVDDLWSIAGTAPSEAA